VTTSTHPSSKKGIAISNDENRGPRGSYAGGPSSADDRARTNASWSVSRLPRISPNGRTWRANWSGPPLDTNTSSNGGAPALEGHIDDSVRARLASQQPTDPFPLTTSSRLSRQGQSAAFGRPRRRR